MAWTTPKTWVANAILTAAQLNTHLRDNLAYLKASPTITALTMTAGASAISAKVGGVIYSASPNVGNVGAGDDTLWTQSIAANTLSANEQELVVEAIVITAATVNSKQVFFKWGATTLTPMNEAQTGNNDHRLRAVVHRTAAGAQEVYCDVMGENNANGGAVSADYAAGTEDETGAVTMAINATGVANDDIVLKTVRVMWQPAGN